MNRFFRCVLRDARFVAVLVLLFPCLPERADAQVDYNRSERLLGWNVEPLVRGSVDGVNWIGESDRFWYRVSRAEGHDFMRVDPGSRVHEPLFDNARLASALSLAADTAFDPASLPFRTFDLEEDEGAIRFDRGDRRYRCDIREYECEVFEVPDRDEGMSVSPDSTWEVFAQEHDLYLRPYGGGDTIRLTFDGEEFWQYGLTAPNAGQIRSGRTRTPAVRWSPDGRRIAVPRTDERGVEHTVMYSSLSPRPEAYQWPYALPGDSIIPRPHYYLIDIPDGTSRKVELDSALVLGGFAGGTDSTWTAEGDRLRLLMYTRGRHEARLIEVDAATADTRTLATERSATFVDMSHGGPDNWYVTTGGEVIWFSQRDGWGHLYRLDRDGRVLNQVTSGPWVVATLQHVDEAAGRLHFTAWGREDGPHPYEAHLYRVNFDGSDLRRLTPEEGHHEVSFSPTGAWFVETRSRTDRPPVTTVRRSSDGGAAMLLENADAGELDAIGWRPPEVFRVKAADGVIDIYGLMYRPSDFDPERRYPVVNFIYPGPQMGSVRSWGFTLEYWAARLQALAELGFVVLTIDHRGTPMRSKAFHDHYYGDLGHNGIPDHVAAIRQLGARHRWMDLGRVGIYGGSGGGFASTRAILEYPEVFHVAVSSAGNHDNRSYHFTWGEKYHGLLERDEDSGEDSYEVQANAPLAGNLEGKLLLIHGDLDDNVHPAMTMQVVHALIEANRDFDLLILPERDHGMREPYVIRRTWDYFVRHLLGEEPPANYEITGPDG